MVIANIAGEIAQQAPKAGKQVIVIGGRKHNGKRGVVFYHGRNPYVNLGRYCTDLQLLLRESRGRDGYRVGILTAAGEKFFTDAVNVEVT